MVSLYIWLSLYTNNKTLRIIWKFDLSSRGVLGRIYALSIEVLRCSHTWSMEVEEGKDQKLDIKLRMCVWRMSLRRTKSAIISWVGSIKNQERECQTPIVRQSIGNHLSLVTRKPVFGVFDQVRLKPAYSHEIANIETGDIILSRQRTTNVLIRLRGCAGWCAPLLFANGKNRFSYDVAHFMHRSIEGKSWVGWMKVNQIRTVFGFIKT